MKYVKSATVDEFVFYHHPFNFFKIGCLFWKITHFRLESHATKRLERLEVTGREAHIVVSLNNFKNSWFEIAETSALSIWSDFD